MFRERTRYEFVNYWMVRPRSSVWSGCGIYWAWAPGETKLTRFGSASTNPTLREHFVSKMSRIKNECGATSCWKIIQNLGNILYWKCLILKTNAAPHLVEKLFIAGTVLWNRIYWKHIKLLDNMPFWYSLEKCWNTRISGNSSWGCSRWATDGWWFYLPTSKPVPFTYITKICISVKNLQQLCKTLQWPSLVEKSALTSTIEFRPDMLFLWLMKWVWSKDAWYKRSKIDQGMVAKKKSNIDHAD